MIRRSDFGIYSEGIRDLGEAPEVIDYFADSLDNKKIYFVVASAKSKSNIQVIAYDRAGAEIINPRRERSFRMKEIEYGVPKWGRYLLILIAVSMAVIFAFLGFKLMVESKEALSLIALGCFFLVAAMVAAISSYKISKDDLVSIVVNAEGMFLRGAGQQSL